MALPNKSIMSLHDLIFFSCFLYILVVFISIPHSRASDGCLEEGSNIIDGKSTLISPGEVFELGFFTPDNGNSKNRYLGIWYYNLSSPKIIVWVANRDKPLLGTNNSLFVKDNNAIMLDTEGRPYWFAFSGSSGGGNSGKRQPNETLQSNPVFNNRYRLTSMNYNVTRKLVRLCLEDSGNLALHKREQGDQILWRSFDNPTDTFLPGMTAAEGSFNLTSWQAANYPATGSFVFTFQLYNGNKLSIKKLHSVLYWESSITPFDQTPQPLLSLFLNNNGSKLKDYSNTRLVMNYTGQIQFWRWDNKRGDWSLLWSEPKNQCDLVEACGSLGICNSYNKGMYCKCLPGSIANQPGDFTQGCLLKSQPCHRTDQSMEDTFLRMPMMKVKAPKTNETDVADCETKCRKDCTCLAYSCGVTDCTATGRSDEKSCMTWSNSELTDLQEEYSEGLTMFIRTTYSDIEFSPKDCNPCGSYIIPYPLSTGASCGDSSYSDFRCNMSTGQVYFSTSNLTYKVTSLDPFAKNFTIHIGPGNSCDSNYIDFSALLPKYTLHYHFWNCKVVKDQSSLEGTLHVSEVEISWKPPPEPACKRSLDCHSWPHTTCKTTRGGKMRCICGFRYKWDGALLKCTELTFFKVQVMVPCIAGALAIILLCATFFSYRSWKNRRDELQRSVELEGGSAESIDVPFFDWQVILAATNNFADSYKLGTGGFGSVYRGKLPDGQEMAVKRLSTLSVQGLEEFRTEVKLIAKLQHRNLVRLIGYCIKAEEKILLYEYMPNGSLDSCLFDERHVVYLDWKKRFDIILGIARGLLYLHQDSRLRIIHRDLKPSNILLDEELNPKISDFGIARIVGGKETQASTGRIVGTYGYMSPEYASEGIFSVKSDVFSFGVVILEAICGRRNSRIYMFEHGLSLPGQAWKLWNEDRGLDLMDPKLNESCLALEVQKCIHIGLLCVQEDPSDRPTMSTVVQMLSTENNSLPLAKQPAFMNRKPLSDSASSSSAKDLSMLQEMMTASTVGR